LEVPVRLLPILALLAGLAACSDVAKVPFADATGPQPVLPDPVLQPIPTVHIAPARGWPDGVHPTAAAGLAVNAFASGLDHPRWLCVLPNGDVLVAETNAPERPDEGKSLKGLAMKMFQKKAGAGAPSANRITLLRDTDGDGVADQRQVFLEGLNSPFGMALIGDQLYVADTDAVVRFPYRNGATHVDAQGVQVVALPAGPRNHHWTKNLIADPAGAKLYVTVGSNSNAAENGIEAEEGRAAIWEVDLKTLRHHVLASGMRNPNGLGWEPSSGRLWTVVNERDELGSDLVPDYLTTVREGAFYGWPYSYYGQHVDERVQPQRPDLVAKAITPDYALGNHVAPLGLVFSGNNSKLPFGEGAFIGQHGSWNRKPLSGYNVVFVPFRDGAPAGEPVEVLGGFVSPEGDAYGRPVGVALDRHGALLVADDVGNTVWRVTSAR
jgi:glucose/arabinose dehydrogenase